MFKETDCYEGGGNHGDKRGVTPISLPHYSKGLVDVVKIQWLMDCMVSCVYMSHGNDGF